jgi:hypothetical protein
METKSETDISESQRFWLNHIHRCTEQGLPLAQYAKANDLKIAKLYYWSRRLTKLGLLRDAQSTASFAAVKIAPAGLSVPVCRLCFSNGAVMEWDRPLEGVALAQLLSLVSRLP